MDAKIDHRRFTRPAIRFLKANIARFHFAAGGAFIRVDPVACGARKVGYDEAIILSGLWIRHYATCFTSDGNRVAEAREPPRESAPTP